MQWRIRFCKFFPFSKFFSYQELRAKKVALPIKSKYLFQRMFGLWYLKEAYSKYRNNAPKILTIRVTVTEQFMKMFQNCAVLRNCAILEHFHELLCNCNSDWYGDFFQHVSFECHIPNIRFKKGRAKGQRLKTFFF